MIHEVGMDSRTSRRTRGWAVVGDCTTERHAQAKQQRATTLGVLSGRDGLVDWFTVAGGMGSMDLVNAALVVVVPHLNPFPGPNSVLVLDNNATHRNPLLQIIRRTGALVAHTPPYTPQYNPIESAFNVAKAWLRRNRALVDAPGVTPFQAMDWALRSITFSTAMGFICGTRVYTWD